MFATCTTDKENTSGAFIAANARLQRQVDSLSAQLDSITQITQLLGNKTGLPTKEDIRYLKQRGLTQPLEAIKADLAKNNRLIPVEGSVGGTMQFYKERIHVLNRKWVLAYFEDGHNAGEMLLEYTVADNGRISWKVLTTDML